MLKQLARNINTVRADDDDLATCTKRKDLLRRDPSWMMLSVTTVQPLFFVKLTRFSYWSGCFFPILNPIEQFNVHRLMIKLTHLLEKTKLASD